MFEGLVFKVANDQERMRALEIRSKIYSTELGSHGVDEFDGTAHHLIVVNQLGELVAASRIIGPRPRPLEIERYVDLGLFLDQRRVPAQTGGLWVREDHRNVSKDAFIPAGMLKLAYNVAKKLRITDFVMYTYARLCPIYRKAFYRSRDLSFKHPSWGEVCVMHLDLLELDQQHASSTEPLAQLIFRTDLPNFLA